MKNIPNIPRLLASRRDGEVFQIFNRLVVRMMAVHPEFGFLIGSRQDTLDIVAMVIGEDLAECAEDPDLEAEIVRAVLLDVVNQPDAAAMLIDIVDRVADTMLDSVTETPAFAGILMACYGLLEIEFEDTLTHAGLKVKAPNRRILQPILANTLKVLEG